MRISNWSLPLASALLVATLSTTGCGGAPMRSVSPAGKSESAARPTTTSAQIAPTDDDAGGTATEVFERARAEMDEHRLAHARTLFDRVVLAEKAQAEAPSPSTLSSLGRAASYNAAVCSEQLDETKDARDRYRALVDALGDVAGSDAAAGAVLVDAQLRRARLDVEVEDFEDLAGASSALLARSDVASGDRGEALAMQALTLLQSKELIAAEKNVHAALRLVVPTDDAVAAPQNAAAVYFARGEVIRARGEAVSFVPVTADFSDKMETRCQAILDAEQAYVEAIKTHELRWAVRAGVRVAAMYISLHDALLEMPEPKAATTDEKKALFRGAMRLRYRILLEKGLGTLERTLTLESATGVKTAWIARAREAKANLERVLAEEKAEIARLPYTESQLQRALDDLAAKHP